MNNQLTKLKILGLPANAIKKMFALLEDKDLLQLREVSSFDNSKEQVCVYLDLSFCEG